MSTSSITRGPRLGGRERLGAFVMTCSYSFAQRGQEQVLYLPHFDLLLDQPIVLTLSFSINPLLGSTPVANLEVDSRSHSTTYVPRLLKTVETPPLHEPTINVDAHELATSGFNCSISNKSSSSRIGLVTKSICLIGWREPVPMVMSYSMNFSQRGHDATVALVNLAGLARG